MRKLLLTLPILLIWFPLMLSAQTSTELSKTFSPEIVARINGVIQKVNLPMQKQLLLGQYFKKQDSLAKSAVLNGAAPDKINQYLTVNPEDLSKILSPLEMNDYLFTRESSAPKFATAIKYRSTLGINKTQTDSLLSLLGAQKLLKGKPNAETKKNENDHLSHVLTKDQYFNLLAIINKDKAVTNTNAAWKQLKDAGLTKGLDSTNVGPQILKFETTLLVNLDLNANSRNPGRPDSIRKLLNPQKPFILLKLDAYNDKLSKSQFAEAIKYRKELNLNDSQIDTLLKKEIRLEAVKKVNKAKTKVDENDPITSVLNKDQYFILLTLTNNDKAVANTNAAWKQLKDFGLTKGLDSTKVKPEILKFETTLLVNLDLNANSKNPGKPDSIRKLLNPQKPFILLKLDAYNDKLSKSQFAEAIKLRKELTLSDSQIDTLLKKEIRLEAMKIANKAHSVDELTDVKEFEAENLIKTLSDLQFHSYLFYKVQNKAIANTKTDWEKLKKIGLTEGQDSVAVNKENLVYEINFTIANEQYTMDKSQQNLFVKKEMENKKPDLLKKMDLANKNLEVNTATKKSLTW